MNDDLLWRDQDDCIALRRSVGALRRRSKRPRSIMLAVICRLLEATANNIEANPTKVRLVVKL